MKWTFDRALIVVFTIAGLALAGAGVAYYFSLRAQQTSDASTRHIEKVQFSIRILYRAMVDAESSQRSYVLTGQDDYIEAFGATLAKAGSLIDEVERLTQDTPAMRSRITKVRALMSVRIAELEETISARRLQGLDAALEIVRSNRGKNLMDDLRALLDTIDDEELARNAASEQGDAREAAEQAHKLKSSARAVGANALADALQALEEAGKAGPKAELKPLAAAVRERLVEVQRDA